MLSERQLIAIREYMKGRSKCQALRIAGYSESVCTTRPENVFGNKAVQEEIARRQMENERKSQVSVDWICEKMMEIIDNPTAKDGDKLRALELLGRNKGMFRDQLEVTVKEDLVERLQRGRQRVSDQAADESQAPDE